MPFVDRRAAGRLLAADLSAFAAEDPIVLALPRGGVPVGAEVARALGAPLDVLAVRKLGAPGNPELAVGAIAEDGSALVDAETARRTGMTKARFEETLAREEQELRRRVTAYRDARPPADLRDRTVIVVDDGLATGLTALVAVEAVRRRDPRRIVLAVPVGSREAVERLSAVADDVVCHQVPRSLRGVGAWYEDFAPVPDREVIATLAAAHANREQRANDGHTSDAPTGRAPDPGLWHIGIDAAGISLHGDLAVPSDAVGIVVFAHGSGSSRHSPRNRAVAHALQEHGLATLLLDLLTEDEQRDRRRVFDIPLLAARLEHAVDWVRRDRRTAQLAVGLFGASTGAAAALVAAARRGEQVRAVVSRGGRPDLAADALPAVTAPTLLIVGGADREVLALNQTAAASLRCPHRVEVIPGATHLFEEPGALEQVAALAGDWLREHLQAPDRTPARPGAAVP